MPKTHDRDRTDEDFRTTVGELKRELERFSEDAEITFGTTTDEKEFYHLIYYRVKADGDLARIELNTMTKKELNKDRKRLGIIP